MVINLVDEFFDNDIHKQVVNEFSEDDIKKIVKVQAQEFMDRFA